MNENEKARLQSRLKERCPNLLGIVVEKDGAVVYEDYFNGGGIDKSAHVFSITKSVVSLLFGIAWGEGLFQNVEEKVLSFFPDYALPKNETTLPKITLANLLTMTAPYRYRSAPYTRYFTSEDWVKSALDLMGGTGRIGDFRYAPVIGPDVLTGILKRISKTSVLIYASRHLFEPLGIAVGKDIVFKDKAGQLAFYHQKFVSGWVKGPNDVHTAGWGLALSARDLAKIGRLCLNHGRWGDRQIVPEKWIEESFRPHSFCPSPISLSYGYLWWVLKEGFAAVGDGGNVIYVNTEKHLVVSMLSSFKPRVFDRMAVIQEEIEPLFNE